jgi:tetratricopeptide (TPR) repeat protein
MPRGGFDVVGRRIAVAVGVWLTLCAGASAHDGPPFSVLMDEPIPGYLVSVWADPDVGEAKFYVITEPQGSESPAVEPTVDVWVQPVSGRLPKVSYPAKRQDVHNQVLFLAEPLFDRQEPWQVGVVIHRTDGQTNELLIEVEATPPGLGPWGLVVYFFPFALFGGLWAFGLMRRWRKSSGEGIPSEQSENSCRAATGGSASNLSSPGSNDIQGSQRAMNSTSTRSGNALVILLLLAAILLAVGGFALWSGFQRQAQPVAPPLKTEVEAKTEAETAVTAEMVEQFSVGVAALEIEENQRAAQIFKELTQSLPEEPAVWCNLGMAMLRLNELPAAKEALSKAAELDPASDQVVGLLALADEREGKIDSAIQRLEALPHPDAAAYYRLAELVQRRSRDAAPQERLALINKILSVDPGNLVAQFERARLAAKIEDAAQLKQSLEVLEQQRDSWDELTTKQFESARSAAEEGRFVEAARFATFLQNMSRPLPRYKASLVELGVTGSSAGTPIRTFLKLPPPGILVAEPDLKLGFELQADSKVEGPAPDWILAAPLFADQPPAVLSLTGAALQIRPSVSVPFPRGEADAATGRHAILTVDLNDDFREDLVLIGSQGLAIHVQNADGGFETHEPKEESRALFAKPGSGVWTLDYDADGDMDLLVTEEGTDGSGACRLIRNNGEMAFESIETFTALPALRELYWLDLDDDGDGDLAALSRDGQTLVAWNERSGKFSEPVPMAADVHAVGLAVGDVDRDGRLDLVVLGDSGKILRISRSKEDKWGGTEIAAWDKAPALAEAFAQHHVGLALADVDNNGAIDLVAAGPAVSAVWLGNVDGSFQRSPQSPSLSMSSVIDMNNDGRLDLVGRAPDGERVAVNQGEKKYQWHTVRPRANPNPGDKRINTFGLGGLIEVRTGRLLQAAPITSPLVHFGLGTHSRAAVARILWPNGTIQAEFDLPAGQVLVADQRLKGSCPWVFTRNDAGMNFVKDFIWRSPLGLKINSLETVGVTQTEDWIKIPGRLLSAQEGRYEVRITADLWETHFFDLVSLLVVDHPSDVDVFVDERFIAAQSPDLRVNAVSPPQPLLAARDEAGTDVSQKLAAIDGQYVDSFKLGTYQGVAEEHWLEFELDEDLPLERPLVLVGHGWIYPTDSSLNVAISQGALPPPHGLILEVPVTEAKSGDALSETRVATDSQEQWRTVSPDLGFPAGKNKTVLIPLPAESLQAGHRRFRLRTNLEVYWDSLGWSAAAPEVKPEPIRVDTLRAELRYRGFSETSPVERRRPDIPVYDRLAAVGPRWLDLEGYYTRFGDIRELLNATDDRYVIMNAGDEMVFEFQAPKEPPAGWVRDFVLVGDGWVKDGDFNTTHSRTVHPLPSHKADHYDRPAGSFFDDPVYQQHVEDWIQFHTRYVAPQASTFRSQ